jgi:two-component system, NtrC family, response regulator AtoC
MKNSGMILIADDDPDFRLSTKILVEVEGFSVCLAATAAEALRCCRDENVDVVLLDWVLGTTSSLEVLRTIGREHPGLPVIVVTGHGSMESAADALREDAFDYLGKPFATGDLAAVLHRAIEWRARTRQPEGGSQPLPPMPTSMVGKSAGMIAVYRMIGRVAPTDSTVLVVGESGTGKELVARALHDNSPRATRSFVAVNCGAFGESLLESELFGYVRGAFTGARADQPGVFETAAGGTIFLDEVTETSPAFQVKLLRVLQEREIRPVGSGMSRKVDVRVVAATNRRMTELLSSSTFRRDLLYRLSVISIELPPLRERREDIALLVDHFLRKANSRLGRSVAAPPDTVGWLSSLDWPGNVRELENAVERAVTLSVGGRLTQADFSQCGEASAPDSAPAIAVPGPPASEINDSSWVCPLPSTLDDVERRHILAMLRYTKGNKLRAAELLGIGRYSLYRKARRLGISIDDGSEKHKHTPESTGG